ncbi:MAG: hypothetical protein GY847_40675 [Proteobacteria bacterium]|nr:hypothetical protein [Pseudomonadota bacterium]
MDYDQPDEFSEQEAGGIPQAQAQAFDDVDIKVSNTGQRIRAILVALVAVVAAGTAIYWWSSKTAAIEGHEKARIDFQRVHTAGYVDFWTMTQIDLKLLKSNQDFEIKMKQIMKDGPVRYSKYVKEKCLPIIDGALPKYKSVTVPSEYADKMDAVSTAAEGLRNAWAGFSDELLKFEGYFKGKKSLDKTSSAWLGAQQSDDDKYTLDAFKYFKLLGCVLPDKKIEELDTSEINNVINESCRKDKAAWFRRVAYDCVPKLLENAGNPSEAYATTLEKSRESERMDHASKFGIEDCLKKSRDSMESEMIEGVALAWANYVKAQNSLLSTIDSKLKELR